MAERMSCQHTRSELTGHLLCTFNEGKQEGIDLERERIGRLLDAYNVGKIDWLELITLVEAEAPKACKCKQ
jgi:hypothetical protein